MKSWTNRVDWTGMIGAVILSVYGWRKEPLAAVLGGVILLADLLIMVAGRRNKDEKKAIIQGFEKNVKK